MSKGIDETFLRLEFDALWDGFSDDKCYLVSLSQRDISILVSCARFTLWPSRWFADGTRLLRDVGRLSDLEIALTYAENLKARLIMACSFEDSLNRIALALESFRPCCPGLAQYVEDGEGGVWYGTEAPVAKPETFGGGEDEFETLSEFQEHLCEAANNIVAGLIMTLNNASLATLASLIAGGIVVGVFVASPPLAVILAVVVAGLASVAFRQMATYIDDNRQDWVCAIFNADGYSDMLVDVDSAISDMVISLDLGTFEVGITDLIHSMLTTDVFNQAYMAVGLPPAIGAVSCAPCIEVPECIDFEYQWGNLIGVEDLGGGSFKFTIQSELDSSLNYHRAIVRVQDPVSCAFDVTLADPTISTGQWGTRAYNGVNYSGTLVNETLPITSEEYATKLTNVVTVFIQNNPGSPSPFTVEYTLQANPH